MTGDPHRPPGKPIQPAAAPGPAQPPGAGAAVILAQEFDAGSLYALRAAVAAHATQASLPEDRTGDIVLAVHELAVNAIRHGAGHGRLLITAYDGALHCQVTDDGKPPPAAVRAAPGAQASGPGDVPWPSPYGHGLWVIRQIADQLSIRSGPGGTTATASFALPPPA